MYKINVYISLISLSLSSCLSFVGFLLILLVLLTTWNKRSKRENILIEKRYRYKTSIAISIFFFLSLSLSLSLSLVLPSLFAPFLKLEQIDTRLKLYIPSKENLMILQCLSRISIPVHDSIKTLHHGTIIIIQHFQLHFKDFFKSFCSS